MSGSMARIASPGRLIRRCLARNILARIDGGSVMPAATQFPVPFMEDVARNAGEPFHSGVLKHPLHTRNCNRPIAVAIITSNRQRGLSGPSDAAPTESDGTLGSSQALLPCEDRRGYDLDDAELRKLFGAAADSSNGRSELALEAILRIYEDRLQRDHQIRTEFFHMLADELGVKRSSVEKAIGAWENLMERGGPADTVPQATLRGVKLLQEACQPPYVPMFRRIGQRPGGIHLLVQMRADLMSAIQGSPSTAAPLRAISESLRSLLADWFSVGITRMERISWETSSASTLEKVVAGEAVHSIHGWRDLRRRLGPSKRVFAFFHPSMPDEPLVILHTALCHGIAGRMRDVLLVSEEEEAPVTGSTVKPTTAVFYSISSTQPGLKGVELGNFLIKQAVTHLQAEMPSLQTLVTLSPIPGFRKWLEEQTHRELHVTSGTEDEADAVAGDETSKRSLLTATEVDACIAGLPAAAVPKAGGDLRLHTAAVAALRSVLATEAWQDDEAMSSVLRPVLLRLCAKYLLHERRRQSALDAVANFHLRNGAWLWRINWGSDASTSGMERSYGMMVNYRYILDDIERNNKMYEADGHIHASKEVTAMACGELLG